jgi:hypothetical protein
LGASRHREHIAMSRETDVVVVRTIGIDTGRIRCIWSA